LIKEFPPREAVAKNIYLAFYRKKKFADSCLRSTTGKITVLLFKMDMNSSGAGTNLLGDFGKCLSMSQFPHLVKMEMTVPLSYCLGLI
jgi:hypothetical protein